MRKTIKDLVIYFNRLVHNNSIKMLSLQYHELVGKTRIMKEKNI